MDAYTLRRRNEDKTLQLGLNSPGSLKLQSLREQHVDILRKEKAQSKEMQQRLGQDLMAQNINVKACHKAIKESRNCGGVRYVHVTPPSELTKEGYAQTVQGLARLAGDVSGLKREMASTVKDERKVLSDAATTGARLDSFASWFARYGEPKRAAEKVEKARSYVLPARWKPHVGWSNALPMRKPFSARPALASMCRAA
eukprot:TRINITY_DN60077_c0_g1_i1.p2 TRINITY_DN60077_c0_g1~~TRINITY_DN60077_c0_g1_i1.p2  ORF type:complete len:199 (+),score=44.87 TRINITY_DN60077_c0_g1_i1:113-709(+)